MSNAAPWQIEEKKVYLRDTFFLLLIVVVSVFLAEQLLLDAEATAVDRLFSYLLFFIPLGTLNFVAHYFYRNRRIRITGNLRSSLRYRLSIAFMLIAVIPSIPIFLISSDNVETVVRGWFRLDMVEAMEASRQVVSHYQETESRDFLRRMSGGLENPFLDVAPRLMIDSLYARGLLSGGDYAGIFEGERVLYESRSLLSPSTMPQFVGSSDPPARVFKRVDGSDYVFFRFSLAGQNSVIIGHRLHEGLERRIELIEQTALALKEEGGGGRVVGTLRLGLALLYILMICGALVASLIIARQISMPIVSLAAATRAVADGDLDTRLEIRASGEMGILIDSFNQMTAELRSLRNRLLHSQRLAAWREVARRLAHEIRNPLTPIQLSADRMLRRLDHPERGDLPRVVRKASATIVEQVKVLKTHVEEFANFARLPRARPAPHDLDGIVPEAVNVFQGLGHPKIEMRLSGNLPDVYIDKTIVIGLINNLVKNAVEAILGQAEARRRKPERIVISTAIRTARGRRFVALTVEDTGPGVSEDLRERIFEPYFTTKGPGGSGLGLALVERAVLEHDAHIQVGRSALGGAEFTVLFMVPEARR